MSLQITALLFFACVGTKKYFIPYSSLNMWHSLTLLLSDHRGLPCLVKGCRHVDVIWKARGERLTKIGNHRSTSFRKTERCWSQPLSLPPSALLFNQKKIIYVWCTSVPPWPLGKITVPSSDLNPAQVNNLTLHSVITEQLPQNNIFSTLCKLN